MIELLWPVQTGKTLFDVWTIVHVCFWIFIGHIAWIFNWNRWYSMAGFLVLALLWEFFERVMEPKKADLWLNPESWANAYFSDMLTCILGVLFIWYALDNWR